MKAPRLHPVVAVLLAGISVVCGAAIAKRLFPALGPAGTAGIRIGLSALMLVAAFRPPMRGMTARQWREIVPWGLALGAMNLTFYYAIARVPLGLAVTVEFIGPLCVAVLGSRRPIDLLWVVMAGAGIALIAPWRADGIDPIGVLFSLLAGIFWAIYIVLGVRVGKEIRGGQGVAAGMVVAAALVVPVALVAPVDGRVAGLLPALTPLLFAQGAAIALLSSAIPYTLEMLALKQMTARAFGILMSLDPAIAGLSGLLFLGERLTQVQWVSIALVITASAGVTLTARRIEPPIEV